MHKRIRIARGDSSTQAFKDTVPEKGQPVYDTKENVLYIGKGNNVKLKDITPLNSIYNIGKKINKQNYTGIKASQGNITITIPVATAANPDTPADFFLQVGKHYRFKGYFDFSAVDLTGFISNGLPFTDEHYPFSVDFFTHFGEAHQTSNLTSKTLHRIIYDVNYETGKGFVVYPSTSDTSKLYIQASAGQGRNDIGQFWIATDARRINGDSSDYFVASYYFNVSPDNNPSNGGQFPQNLKVILTDIIELDEYATV